MPVRRRVLESKAVLNPVYVIGGLGIVLFLLFWEQWNRAERVQKELDDLKRELQAALAALTEFERQVDGIYQKEKRHSS